MDFPIYRKYTNNKSFFIITSENSWIEYKLVGKKYNRFEFTANIFPEKLFIKDLIQKIDGVEECSLAQLESQICNLKFEI